MIKIISDSASLYTRKEAIENGLDVSYLVVSINGNAYKEHEEIQTAPFIEMINEGHIPSTSQPSIGDVLDLYQTYPEDEIINITIADGLSGTFNSACTAKNMDTNPDRIDVINSKTLCGPQRYLVDTAIALIKAGYTKEAIIKELTELSNYSKSYLMPKDFDFLVRGGRLSPLVGKIGGLIKLVPVTVLSEDGTCLEKFTTTRSFKKAIEKIGAAMQQDGVTSGYKIYISHAYEEGLAIQAEEILTTLLPNVDIERLILGPAFTTQGGPGCIAIQWVKKHPIMND